MTQNNENSSLKTEFSYKPSTEIRKQIDQELNKALESFKPTKPRKWQYDNKKSFDENMLSLDKFRDQLKQDGE